jgi:hypothetical protein
MYDIAVVPEAGLFVTVGAGGSVRQGTVVHDRIEWTKSTRLGDKDLYEHGDYGWRERHHAVGNTQWKSGQLGSAVGNQYPHTAPRRRP